MLNSRSYHPVWLRHPFLKLCRKSHISSSSLQKLPNQDSKDQIPHNTETNKRYHVHQLTPESKRCQGPIPKKPNFVLTFLREFLGPLGTSGIKRRLSTNYRR